MSDVEIKSVLKYTNNDIESAIRAMEALSLNVPSNDNYFLDGRVDESGVGDDDH